MWSFVRHALLGVAITGAVLLWLHEEPSEGVMMIDLSRTDIIDWSAVPGYRDTLYAVMEREGELVIDCGRYGRIIGQIRSISGDTLLMCDVGYEPFPTMDLDAIGDAR